MISLTGVRDDFEEVKTKKLSWEAARSSKKAQERLYVRKEARPKAQNQGTNGLKVEGNARGLLCDVMEGRGPRSPPSM